MSTFNCNFCNNIYSAKNSLLLHQRTAKFCLKIQSEISLKNEERIKKNEEKMRKNEERIKENEKIKASNNSENNKSELCKENEKKFICEFCNYNFNYKHHLLKHYEICKVKQRNIKNEKEKELESMKKEVQLLSTELALAKNDLKNSDLIKAEKDNTIKNLTLERDNLLKQLFDLKSNPTITNNYNNSSQTTSTKVANICNVNNKLPLTKEFFTNLGNKIDFKNQKFRDEKDICRYTLKQGLNRFVMVLDKSRRVLTFTDENGNTIRDQDGVKLANQLYEELSTRLEGVQEHLEGLQDDPSEYLIPTTLDRRKKIVEWILNKNPESLERFGKAYFNEYTKFEINPISLTNNSQTTPTLIDDSKTQDKVKVKNSQLFKLNYDTFSTFKSRLKNIFYKYNFDMFNYGLHTMGGFIYQFKDELEMIIDEDVNSLKIKDDVGLKIDLDANQFFELLKTIFSEEDLINIINSNKSLDPTFTENALKFNTIFILKNKIDENLIDEIFRGVTNNIEY